MTVVAVAFPSVGKERRKLIYLTLTIGGGQHAVHWAVKEKWSEGLCTGASSRSSNLVGACDKQRFFAGYEGLIVVPKQGGWRD